MTFYWWSHWFWITLIGVALVSSYPSQEFSSELGETENEKNIRTVTKLYQATGAFSWSSSISPEITEKTVLKSISPAKDLDDLLDDEEIDVEDAFSTANLEDNFSEAEESLQTEPILNQLKKHYHKTKENEETGNGEEDNDYAFDDNENLEEDISGEDLKRSAEILSKTHENLDLDFETSKGSIKVLKAEVIETTNSSISQTKEELQNSSNSINSTTNSQFVPIKPKDQIDEIKPSFATPSTPQIMNANKSISITKDSTKAPILSSNLTESTEEIHKVPFTLENVNREDEIRRAENEHRTRKPKVLSADYKNLNRFINYSSQTKSLLTRSASTEPNEYDNNNIASEALSVQRTYFLDASAISAICFTIFGVCCTIATIGLVLYRRRYLNKPQTLSEPDSSVYIDDSTLRVSDNSDEMYSLDNDSFLNSLEAMTIQNYWTDTVKHTKL